MLITSFYQFEKLLYISPIKIKTLIMKGTNWKLFFSLLLGLQVVLILWSIWLMSTGGNAWVGTFNIALNSFFGWQNAMILIDMKTKEKQTD